MSSSPINLSSFIREKTGLELQVSVKDNPAKLKTFKAGEREEEMKKKLSKEVKTLLTDGLTLKLDPDEERQIFDRV